MADQREQAAGAPHPATIVGALLERAERHGDRPAFTVLDLDGRSVTLTYGELLRRSLCAAVALKQRGLRQGDRILICLPTSPALLTAIYGTMLAGGVCVPVYPPNPAQGLKRWKEQVLAVARVAQVRGAAVAARGSLHMAAALEQVDEDLFTVVPADLDGRTEARESAPIIPEADLAFVQFTSGTTQQPRGVSVTHAALMANMRGLLSVMRLSDADISVSWLPPYHDMGLVGHIFVPVLCGVHQYLMPPAVIVRRAARWLQVISQVRATQTTAPNFAYSMCVRRITRAERAGLDLSCLRWVLNGAEMVQAETLRAFDETFGPCGFRSDAFRPVYGLAETTLTATFCPEGGASVDTVDRDHLAADGHARPVAAGRPQAQSFVAVGLPLPGHELMIERAGGRPAAVREVGEIRLRGPSVMGGYFNDPQATAEVLRAGWLHTGDLGYRDERGLLHVTGRVKELIIKGGRNYLPQDFEAACLETPGLRPGRVVAFGTANARTGTEDVVIVAETRDAARVHDPVLLQRVARAVGERTGLRPDRVDLAAPGTLPRTTSGKLQRGRVKAAYEAGLALHGPPFSAVESVREAFRSLADLTVAKISRMLGWQ